MFLVNTFQIVPRGLDRACQGSLALLYTLCSVTCCTHQNHSLAEGPHKTEQAWQQNV